MDQGGTTNTGEVLSTTLNRRWLVKMGIFIAAMIGLGLWGTWDAFLVYPARGHAFADFMKLDYLKQAEKESSLLRASVDDPDAELKRLKDNKQSISSLEQARFNWLESLSVVSNLRNASAANKKEAAKPIGERADTLTTFKDPNVTLAALEASLKGKTKPKPLSALDIPSQFLFMIVGFGGALWMLAFLAKCARVKYRYEPATHALTIPDGRRFTPDQIVEVDRRLWHKFFVFLKPSDGSSDFKLDLLRYTPLEDWFLELEKHTPNYKPEEVAVATAEATEKSMSA